MDLSLSPRSAARAATERYVLSLPPGCGFRTLGASMAPFNVVSHGRVLFDTHNEFRFAVARQSGGIVLFIIYAKREENVRADRRSSGQS